MRSRHPAVLRAAGALAIAAAAGIWLGHAGADKPGAPAVRSLHVGGATLIVPRESRTLASRVVAGDPIVTLAGTRGSAQRVLVTVGPADDPSLVPRALRALAGGADRRERETRLAGHRAWLYAGLPGPTPGTTLDVTVLPSGRGVLGIGCVSERRDRAAPRDCARSIASLSFGDAPLFVPASDLALRLRAGRVLSALDAARVRDRARLQASGTPAGQSALARDLQRLHLAAAASLQPLAGRAGAPLLASLTGAADAYRALGRAVRGRSPARFADARQAVQAADTRLAAAVARLTPPPASDAPTAAGPAPSRSASPLVEALFLVSLLGIIATLLWKPLTAYRAAHVRRPIPPVAASVPRPGASAPHWDAPPDALRPRSP